MSSTLAARKLDGAEILTQITGQQVLDRHLTPRLMFLSAMTTVLVGVAYADGHVANQEKLYFREVLNQFVSPESSLGRMISLMLKGVSKHRIYAHPEAISCLTNSQDIKGREIVRKAIQD